MDTLDVFKTLFFTYPSNLIFLPIVGILILSFFPKEQKLAIKSFLFVVAVLELALAIKLYCDFQQTAMMDQFILDLPWINWWNVHYRLGVNGVSLMMVLLTAFLLVVALMGTWNSVQKNLKLYAMSLLGLLTGMMGVFLATDLFLFFVFWEIILIPMYFLIGIWGGENRGYAAIKFVIYTMAGSVLMLLAIIYLYFKGGNTFDLNQFYSQENFFLTFREQVVLFLAMGIAFAIKVPLFPTHTWLPDAHVQAPTMGSVLLAGILLKMGVYGFFRFAIPLFPQAAYFLQPYLMGLAAFGVVYGALVAMVQPDIKKLIAYSSVSHMGVVMLGVFSYQTLGLTGGLFQMLNHGLSTGALFLLIGMLYDRTHTRAIKDYSGLAKVMPVFTVLFLIATLSSIAVPLTNGFVGEFLTLMGSFAVNRGFTIMAATGVILGAVYMLWLVQRVFLGPVKETPGTKGQDLKMREVVTMLPLVILIFALGIAPTSFLKKLELPAEMVSLKVNEVKLALENSKNDDHRLAKNQNSVEK